MKIALVHDFLCGIGGSERVFQYLCEEFKEADLYTFSYNPETTLPYFKTRSIQTSWLNPWIQTPERFRWSFPLATQVMKRWDLSHYDLVLTSSATVAKYVKAPEERHICYCYFPTRALWTFGQYFGKGWKGNLVRPLLRFLQTQDFAAAQKVDRFIAISDVSKRAIQEYYGKIAEVLHCPIETDKFVCRFEPRQDHYLLVSRLEKWKQVDYAIEAFNISGKPLKIIGKGAEEATLRRIAHKNIEFLGEVNDESLVDAYNQCKAVIFTPFLEYGLIPLEANACGTPVVCYGKGGVTETMIPLGSSPKPTAVFFDERTPHALMDAIHRFEQASFDSAALVQHAAQWSVGAFQKAMRQKVIDFAVGKTINQQP